MTKIPAKYLRDDNAEGKNILKKHKTRGFSKDVYLLGCDDDGTAYWLEAPSWDCGWYWGFGYVETYTRNWNPEASRDISSHSHIDSSFLGSQEEYIQDKIVRGEYVHNLYDSKKFEHTTFTEKEGWELTELFRRFYRLQQSAEMFRGGSAGTSGSSDYLKREGWSKEINEVLIPETTKRIIEILS